MRIGDLANRLGVSTSKIRYLENKGLIRPTRGHRNRYRTYDEESTIRLSMMLQAQTLGFTLQEIKQAFTNNKTLECEPFIALLLDKRNGNVWFIPKGDDINISFRDPAFVVRIPLEKLDQAPR